MKLKLNGTDYKRVPEQTQYLLPLIFEEVNENPVKMKVRNALANIRDVLDFIEETKLEKEEEYQEGSLTIVQSTSDFLLGLQELLSSEDEESILSCDCANSEEKTEESWCKLEGLLKGWFNNLLLTEELETAIQIFAAVFNRSFGLTIGKIQIKDDIPVFDSCASGKKTQFLFPLELTTKKTGIQREIQMTEAFEKFNAGILHVGDQVCFLIHEKDLIKPMNQNFFLRCVAKKGTKSDILYVWNDIDVLAQFLKETDYEFLSFFNAKKEFLFDFDAGTKEFVIEKPSYSTLPIAWKHVKESCMNEDWFILNDSPFLVL